MHLFAIQKLITILVALSSSSSVVAKADKIGVAANQIISNKGKLTYVGNLDPIIVHSHATKMKWSKVRHVDGYDPTLEDPMQYVENGATSEEVDMKLRPTLTYTLTQRLSNQIFSSLVSKLPIEDVQDIMEMKGNDALHDLEPVCKVEEREEELQQKEENKKDNFGSDNDENYARYLQKKEEKEEICSVAFVSLQHYYGISFNFTLILSTLPMTSLTAEDIMNRHTPDHRGWTKPISNTEAFVNLELMCPEPAESSMEGKRILAGNSATVLRKTVEVDESNTEEILELLLQKSKAILGMTYSKVLKRSAIEEQKVWLKNTTGKGEEQNGAEEIIVEDKDDGNSSTENTSKTQELEYSREILPDIAQLCLEQNMNEADCFEIQKKVLELDDSGLNDDTKQQNNEKNSSEMSEEEMMDAMDTMTAGIIANDIGDVDGEWNLPIEDLVDLRRDLESLDKLMEVKEA